jgi:hypothetical protein
VKIVRAQTNSIFSTIGIGGIEVLDTSAHVLWHKVLSSGLTKQKDSDSSSKKVAQTSSFMSLQWMESSAMEIQLSSRSLKATADQTQSTSARSKSEIN